MQSLVRAMEDISMREILHKADPVYALATFKTKVHLNIVFAFSIDNNC